MVHGREYFFGYGISSTRAGQTPFGQPDMVVCLGSTEVPPDMLHTLIHDLRPRFRPEDYNVSCAYSLVYSQTPFVAHKYTCVYHVLVSMQER